VQIRKISNYINIFTFLLNQCFIRVLSVVKNNCVFVNASSLSSPSLPSRIEPVHSLPRQSRLKIITGPVMNPPLTIFENQTFLFFLNLNRFNTIETVNAFPRKSRLKLEAHNRKIEDVVPGRFFRLPSLYAQKSCQMDRLSLSIRWNHHLKENASTLRRHPNIKTLPQNRYSGHTSAAKSHWSFPWYFCWVRLPIWPRSWHLNYNARRPHISAGL